MIGLHVTFLNSKFYRMSYRVLPWGTDLNQEAQRTMFVTHVWPRECFFFFFFFKPHKNKNFLLLLKFWNVYPTSLWTKLSKAELPPELEATLCGMPQLSHPSPPWSLQPVSFTYYQAAWSRQQK